MFGALGIEYLFENVMKAVAFEPPKGKYTKEFACDFLGPRVRAGVVFSPTALA